MKWFFSIFFIFFSLPVFSYNLEANYQIKTKGVTIGSLKWNLAIEDKTYKTYIDLKDRGLISKLYSFEGKYRAVGKIKNNILFSLEYNQFWKTKKKERVIKIKYNEAAIEKLTISPEEKEHPRVDYKKLKNYNDPLTSFLNIILNNIPSYTIDGRRAYLLSPTKNKESTKILIEGYVNIWADHKRNDLDYLEVYMEENRVLPKKIKILFKGSVFTLKKI